MKDFPLLPFALIAGIVFLAMRRKDDAVLLPPVTVYAPIDKPISFPTDFQYEEMPLPPINVTPRSQSLLDRIFVNPDPWNPILRQGVI